MCGTGTEVGKTWVGGRLLRELRGRGLSVAARKPAQSFAIDSEGVRLGGATDAEVLGSASGEDPDVVCHPFRSYHRAMAPPMAAEALGLPASRVGDLIEELAWPPERVQVGVVETAGGVRSPQASDGDATDLLVELAPDAGGAGGRRRTRHHQRRAAVDGRTGHGDRAIGSRGGGARPVRRPPRHPPAQSRVAGRAPRLPGGDPARPGVGLGRRGHRPRAGGRAGSTGSPAVTGRARRRRPPPG